MKRVLMAMIIVGFAGGVYAADFSDLQAFKASDVKDVVIKASAVLSAGNAVCNEAKAQEEYLKVLNTEPVTNIKINTFTGQFGNEKKIAVLGSYDLKTTGFGPTETIPMGGYAFYDAATCVRGENMFMQLHAVKASVNNPVSNEEKAEANYIKALYTTPITNLKINEYTVQFGNEKGKIIVMGTYDILTTGVGVIPVANYASYDATTVVLGGNLSLMLHPVK